MITDESPDRPLDVAVEIGRHLERIEQETRARRAIEEGAENRRILIAELEFLAGAKELARVMEKTPPTNLPLPVRRAASQFLVLYRRTLRHG